MATPPHTPRHRLESWKEIADFLRCDVKTAQRREKERGLPVYRLPGGRRAGVFAYEDELLEWMHSAPQPAEPGAPELAAAPTPTPTRRKILWPATALGASAAVGVPAYYLFRSRPNPEACELTGQTLVALGPRRETLWQHHFDRPVRPIELQDRYHRLRFVDWNGDGRVCVLIAVAHAGTADENLGEVALYCFSPGGRLLWSQDLNPALKDAWGRSFDPLWMVTDTLVTRAGRNPALFWISLAHSVRWPGVVLRFDARGNSVVRFAHPGNVQRLCSVASSFGPALVVAGVNNAENRTFVALLGEADPPSTSPPVVKHYQYSSGPTGSARAYVLLPPSEYNQLYDAPYSHVAGLSTSGGTVLATLFLGAAGGIHNTYTFDCDLRPLEATHRGSEPFLHRQLEERNLVAHTYAACPERTKAPILRYWTPGDGWKDTPVRWDDSRFDPSS